MERMQVWGDSILKGIVYDEERDKYVVLPENALSYVEGQGRLEIKNFSRFGQTAPRASQKLDRQLEVEAAPDMILLELGGNDCDFDWASIAEAPDRDHQPNTPLDTFYQCLSGMVKKVMDRGIKPILATLPPLEPNRYFRFFTRTGLNQANILKWMKTTQTIYTWHEQYDLYVRRIAEAFQVSLIDIRAAFLNKPDYAHYLCLDGIHPNNRGQRLIGDVIGEFFRRLPPLGRG